MKQPTLNAKSKDGKHEWTRATLCALHEGGMSDTEIAEMFETAEAFVSFGRKRESFWEASPMVEPPKEPVEIVAEVAEPKPEPIVKAKKKEPAGEK